MDYCKPKAHLHFWRWVFGWQWPGVHSKHTETWELVINCKRSWNICREFLEFKASLVHLTLRIDAHKLESNISELGWSPQFPRNEDSIGQLADGQLYLIWVVKLWITSIQIADRGGKPECIGIMFLKKLALKRAKMPQRPPFIFKLGVGISIWWLRTPHFKLDALFWGKELFQSQNWPSALELVER